MANTEVVGARHTVLAKGGTREAHSLTLGLILNCKVWFALLTSLIIRAIFATVYAIYNDKDIINMVNIPLQM